MIKIFFFAKLREDLGVSELELQIKPSLKTLHDVVLDIAAQHGDLFSSTLFGNNIVIAKNHDVVDMAARVSDNDEIAFFPPVTGG